MRMIVRAPNHELEAAFNWFVDTCASRYALAITASPPTAAEKPSTSDFKACTLMSDQALTIGPMIPEIIAVMMDMITRGRPRVGDTVVALCASRRLSANPRRG